MLFVRTFQTTVLLFTMCEYLESCEVLELRKISNKIYQAIQSIKKNAFLW